MNRPSKFIFPIAAIFFILTSICFAGQYKCTRFVDGDTIKVVNNGNQLTIRLVGIDAPETSKKKRQPGQPFSQKSTKYLASLILNKTVEIKSYGQDRYGRTLGVIYVNDINVNIEMVQAGLAEVYRGPPASGLDLDPYWKAEEEAKKSKREMWVLGDKYISPRKWRRMNK
jgi:endonuclease YncB( thermonuclease family)